MEEGSSMRSRRRTFFRSCNINYRRRFFHGNAWKKVLPWDPTEELVPQQCIEKPSSTVVILTTEEGSSAAMHGRRFFHEIPQKNFFRDNARKKVLPQLLISIAEKGSSMHCCRRTSSAESHERTLFRINKLAFYRKDTVKGILGIMKNCWVHQQCCWVPLASPDDQTHSMSWGPTRKNVFISLAQSTKLLFL